MSADQLNRVAILAFASLLSFIQACDSSNWPTDPQFVLDILADEQQEFLAIEAQMRSDNIRFISDDLLTSEPQGQADSMNHLLAFIVRDNYLGLVRRNSPYVFEISKSIFSVAVPLPPTNGRDFLMQLKHDETQSIQNVCDSKILKSTCGQCAIQIDDMWSGHWAWTPEDPTIADENCRSRRSVN